MLNWIQHFAVKTLVHAEKWFEKATGTIWKEDLVSKDWRRRYQFTLRRRIQGTLLVTKIEREQLCILPRKEVCETTVGYVRP